MRGFRCAYQGDIAIGQVALAVPSFGRPVVTNPPYAETLPLALLSHFLRTAPSTWLPLKGACQ